MGVFVSRTSLLRSGVSALALSAFAVFSAQAASFDITSGTVTTPQTLANGETGNVDSGAELSVTANGSSGNAVTVNGNTVVITNAGLIQNLGTGRAIQAPSGGGTTRDITKVRSGDLILEGRSYLSFPRASAFACDGRLIRIAIGSQYGPDDHLLYEWLRAS